MANKLATAISVVFHPLLMTTGLFTILFAVGSPVVAELSSAFRPFLFITFLVTFIIPVLSLSILRFSKTIKDFTLVERKDRIIPFVFISIFYLTTTWMFMSKYGLGPLINLIFVAISAIIATLTIITLFWKISAHGAGIGGLLGFLVAFYITAPQSGLIWAIILVILVAGVVMSSRLYLNVHRPREVHAGSLVGFLISFATILLFS